MTRNSVIHSGLALVAFALCACSGHGTDGGQTVETEDGGTAVGGTFVPQVGGVPDAAPPFGPLDPRPCGSMGLGSVLATAFSPDGKLLAVAGNRIRLMSTSDWQEIRQFADAPSLVSYGWERLAFTSGGTLLVSVAYYSGQVAVWRVEDGTLAYSLSSPVNSNLWDGAQSVATSAVGLLALTDGNSVVLWDVAEQRTVQAITPSSGKVGHLALSDAGDILAIEELEGQVADGGTQAATARISLWNADTGRWLRTVATDGAQAGALTFSPGADVLAIALRDSSSTCGYAYYCDAHVYFYRASDGTLLRWTSSFEVYSMQGWRAELNYAPAGDLVAVSSDDVNLGARILSIIRAFDGAELNQLSFNGGAISLSPNGQLAIPNGASVEIRDPLDGTITSVVSQRVLSYVSTAAFSPDGELLATAGGVTGYPGYNGIRDYSLYLWHFADGVLISQLQGHGGGVRSLAFSPDGQTIASASDDATVRMWSTTGASLPVVLGQDRPVSTVAFSPDGTLLASGDTEGTLLLRSAQDGSVVRTLKSQDAVYALVFSKDGTLLATGGSNPTIMLWDVETGQPIASASHGYLVNALAFSPDGSWLASAASAGPSGLGGDPNIQLWQVVGSSLVARTAIAVGEFHESYPYFVWGLAISSDGTTLLAAGPKYRGQMYRLPGGEHIGEFAQLPSGGAFAVSRDTSHIAFGYSGAIELWCRTP